MMMNDRKKGPAETGPRGLQRSEMGSGTMADSATSIPDRIDNFSRRLIVDALSRGLAATWRRRANALESARPRPSDYTGRATSAHIAEQDQRLARKAQNARDHATIVEFDDANDMIAEVLAGGDRHV